MGRRDNSVRTARVKSRNMYEGHRDKDNEVQIAFESRRLDGVGDSNGEENGDN